MSLVHMVSNWIKHRAKSSGITNIHSPYVFDLMTALRKSTIPANSAKIEMIRKRLEKDSSLISVDDYGAGSRKDLTGSRRIRDIARTSVKPARHAKILHRLAAHLKAGNVLELGTSLGLTTAYLASTVKMNNGKVYTIEGAPEVMAIAQSVFDELGLDNVHSYAGRFGDVLPGLLNDMESPDLIFIDGNHKKVPTMKYLDTILEHCHDESVFVLDDIYWSDEMTDCWHELTDDDRFHVSIDFYHMGILVPRKHQAKEHFILRL